MKGRKIRLVVDLPVTSQADGITAEVLTQVMTLLMTQGLPKGARVVSTQVMEEEE